MTWISAGIYGYELHKVGTGCVATLWWNGQYWELQSRPVGDCQCHPAFKLADAERAKLWAQGRWKL